MVSLSKVQADVERQAFRKTEMALSVIRKAVERIDENSASRCLSTRFNYLLLKSENCTTFRHVLLGKTSLAGSSSGLFHRESEKKII